MVAEDSGAQGDEIFGAIVFDNLIGPYASLGKQGI